MSAYLLQLFLQKKRALWFLFSTEHSSHHSVLLQLLQRIIRTICFLLTGIQHHQMVGALFQLVLA